MRGLAEAGTCTLDGLRNYLDQEKEVGILRSRSGTVTLLDVVALDVDSLQGRGRELLSVSGLPRQRAQR